MSDYLLEVRNLSKVFPGTVALEDVSIGFRRGEIHGIIGKNGAGKSTLLNVLSGILPPSSGRILVRGAEFTHLTPGRAKREGITIVTQKPETVPDFSVVQNLFLPQFPRNRLGGLDWKQMSVEAERIFREAGLRIDVKRKMRDLSLDEEQVFLLLKAFSVDKKEFVLLDEVTTSFSRKEQEFFFRLIADQKSKGKLIIFISHRLDEILQVCDRVTVLRDGRVAGTVERRELDRQVLSSMVVGTKDEASTGGRTGMPEVAPAGGTSGDSATVLSVRGFCLGGGFEDVSFQLRAGEILGLAGLVGSGRSELLRAIAGILPPEAGTLELSGHEVGPFRSPSQAIRCGVVYLTENRDEDGLVNIHSVMHNLTLSYLIAISRGMLIDRANVRRTAEGLVASLEIVASSLEEEVQNLSGGNRQKVLLGRVASTRAKVLLLDEPTKGIDISAKRSILKSIRNDLSRHSGIIMTSPGLEEILEVSDRILVLHEGRVTREFTRNEFDELAVYRAIQGIGS